MVCCNGRSYQNSGEDIALVGLLKACTLRKDVHRGSRAHADILERGLLEKNIFIGNALVNMYATFGALAEAQQVFNQLANRDVVSWNTLAAGYIQHGHSETAANCFPQMQHQALFPDAVTFACILKAYGCIRAVEKGKRLHACITESYGNLWPACKGKNVQTRSAQKAVLGDGSVLESSLLDMYAKCGALARAQQVFDGLSARDKVSWTALIAGYGEQGYGEEALNCFELMQEEGITPDAVTFTCTLNACGSIGAIEKGQEIHAEIMRRQLLRKDTILGSALVDMYAKCALLAVAQEVFDCLPVQDKISWTALLGGYCQHEQSEEALNCFEIMKHKGLPLDTLTFACILKACGNIGALEKGKELHAEIARKGLLGIDKVLEGALLDMYVKCGTLGKAQEVFEDFALQDIVSWTVLFAGYCKQGFQEKALDCLEQLQGEGLYADAVTFAGILKLCGTMRAIEMGKEIHAEIARRNCLEKDVVLGSALVDMYAKCGVLAKAQQVFDALPNQDLVSWTALILGYCEHGHDKKSFECFERMKQEGLSPNVVTLMCMLKACRSIGAAGRGKELCVDFFGKALANSVILGNAVMDMYANCGAFVKAKQVFDELPDRDVVSWNGMIVSCFENEVVEEALDFYEGMKFEGVSADALTFTYILKACACTGAVEKGKQIHSEMVKKGSIENNLVLGNALVDMYAKCCALAKAQRVFDKLTVRDVVSWNSLMTGYYQHGLSEQVLNCLKKMKDDGFSPDAVTFACILKTSGSIGAAANSEMFYEAMSASYGIIPTVEHHSCMVGLLGHAGLFDKAVSVIVKIPALHYHLPTWFALLDACQIWGNVKLGRLAFELAARLK